MAETWDKLFRQVALRGGLLKADTATALEANYTAINIGQTEMDDRAVMFPKTSVDDSLLMSCDQIIRAFAGNAHSPYRRDFEDVTDTIADFTRLPMITSTGKPIVGVIGDVRDAIDGTALERLDTSDEVGLLGNMSLNLKQKVFFYWTDDVLIHHTRSTGVVCDVVAWDKEAERAKMIANPRGDCAFPEDLHEAIICGALANLFRASYNAEQVEAWATYFKIKLAEISKMGVAETVSA